MFDAALNMTWDILLSGRSVSLSPTRRVGIYHYGIFNKFVEGTSLGSNSLGENMWFDKGTSQDDDSAA